MVAEVLMAEPDEGVLGPPPGMPDDVWARALDEAFSYEFDSGDDAFADLVPADHAMPLDGTPDDGSESVVLDLDADELFGDGDDAFETPPAAQTSAAPNEDAACDGDTHPDAHADVDDGFATVDGDAGDAEWHALGGETTDDGGDVVEDDAWLGGDAGSSDHVDLG